MIERIDLFVAKSVDDLVDKLLADKKGIQSKLGNRFGADYREVREYFVKVGGVPADIKLGCLPSQDRYWFDFMFMHPHPRLDLKAKQTQIEQIFAKYEVIFKLHQGSDYEFYELNSTTTTKKLFRVPKKEKGAGIGFVRDSGIQLDLDYPRASGLLKELLALYLNPDK